MRYWVNPGEKELKEGSENKKAGFLDPVKQVSKITLEQHVDLRTLPCLSLSERQIIGQKHDTTQFFWEILIVATTPHKPVVKSNSAADQNVQVPSCTGRRVVR